MDILLVEDETLVRSLLAEMLRESGFDVAETGSAEEALALAERAGRPNLLVTDINLGPGMDGLDLAATARQHWPALPVVYISGRYANVDGLGPSDRFLPKPFRVNVLLDAIRELRSAASSRRCAAGAH